MVAIMMVRTCCRRFDLFQLPFQPVGLLGHFGSGAPLFREHGFEVRDDLNLGLAVVHALFCRDMVMALLFC